MKGFSLLLTFIIWNNFIIIKFSNIWLLHGIETWTLGRIDRNRTKAAEMKYVRTVKSFH
jgi:hypothetical protein